MKKLIGVLILVLILLATALPVFAGGDQNHGSIGNGSVCRYENPFVDASCVHVP